MSRPQSQKTVNYPDVLGAITGGKRVALDVMDVALAARPNRVEAGKPFEALVLLQNCVNVPVDAVLHLSIPTHDQAKKTNQFSTRATKPLRIGLQAGEVGFAVLPINTTPQAAPGQDYKFDLDVQVECKAKTLTRVRDANQHALFQRASIDPKRTPAYESIDGLMFTVDLSTKSNRPTAIGPGVIKASFTVKFAMLPSSSAVPGKTPELKPGFIPLWSQADYREVAGETVQAVHGNLPPEIPIPDVVPPRGTPSRETPDPVTEVLRKLDRKSVFFTLLKATSGRCEAAGYRLWAGEAVMITKLMCYVLEQGVADGPRWLKALRSEVGRNPRIANNLEALLTEEIYPELVFDAARSGFDSLRVATGEQFGTDEEITEYIEELLRLLIGVSGPLEVTHTYLPLVLGGLLIHTKMLMPQESPQETVKLLQKAVQNRVAEKNDDNEFLFTITNDLIRRTLG